MTVLRRAIRTLLVASLLTGAGIAAPVARAAPGASDLVVVAAGMATKMITVRGTLSPGHPFDSFQFRSHAHYVGFLLSDQHGHPLLGRVVVPGFDLAGDSIPIWYTSRPMPPGRYRLTVFADAPVRLVLPLAHGPGQTVRLATSSRPFAKLVWSSTPSAGPVDGQFGNVQIPLVDGRFSVVTLDRFFTGNMSQAEAGDECLTGVAAPCPVGGADTGSDYFLTPGSTGASGGAFGWSGSPARTSSKEKAVFDQLQASASGRVAGLVLLAP